ncbi:DUF1120 domain-containing protein [Enterobacter hormaechei]|uniref:DUF1120 domain-containing protein n=1 Tax=Enterobacter hormaechei TaxID=158836 RepID=UPI002A761784|nr:DUF1120 domain-containing protein [Enterobacter hormaechei]MDY3572507.1 DUF1120 domain-containing protein [Enterobacter hormaechei]
MKTQMNTILLMIPGAALAAFMMNAARATDSVDLVVQVTAVTGACTPSLDTPVINLGVIPYNTLNATAPTALPEKKVLLTVNCTSPMAVGWTLTDNRTDSVAQLPVTLSGRQYSGTALAGLGKTPAGIPLGNWAISTGTEAAVQHDGTTGIAITSTDGGTTWRSAAGTPADVSFAGNLLTSVTDATTAPPVPFTTGTFSLSMGAVIAPRNTLNLTDDTLLDGSATFTLVYL